MKPANGVILYEGPSRIDGSPIVVICTWKSKNTKTGDMLQTWIIRSDISPQAAINQGLDYGVCGNCKLRPINRAIRRALGIRRPCYVKAYNAPRSVFDAYHRGRYDYDVSRIPNIKIRFGSYGDPCACPLRIWFRLKAVHNQESTGFTHQWLLPKNRPYRVLLMASVDTPDEALKATSYGFRLFAVQHAETNRYGWNGLPKMAKCPASKESGANKTCETCMACNGAPIESKRASITILAH